MKIAAKKAEPEKAPDKKPEQEAPKEAPKKDADKAPAEDTPKMNIMRVYKGPHFKMLHARMTDPAMAAKVHKMVSACTGQNCK